jgi:hypothetical protein
MGHVHKLQGNPIKKKTPSEDVEINKMTKRVELPTKHHESKESYKTSDKYVGSLAVYSITKNSNVFKFHYLIVVYHNNSFYLTILCTK